MSDLLLASGQWDEELVKAIFLPIDTRAILGIPVRSQEEDWWAWEPEKFGDYTVKSAYRKLSEANMAQTDLSPGVSNDESWNRLWKLNVPPKVKVFWWRVLHEFLPAKVILHHRHIEPTSFCDVCGADSESIKHVLTDCTIARLFWRDIKSLTGVKLPRLHPLTWASDILRGSFCSEKDRCLLTIGMYSLWAQRNKRGHGEDQLPLRQAVRWATDLGHDLWQITMSSKLKPAAKARSFWCAPQEGWVKCNTDGAFYPESGQGATGAVLRGPAGIFEGGRAKMVRPRP